MLNSFNSLLISQPDLKDAVKALRAETFRAIMILTSLAAGLLLLYIGLEHPNYLVEIWIILAIYAVGVWVLNWFPKRPFLGQVAWLVGLFAAIAVALRLSGIVELVYLLAWLPFVAATTLNWRSGAVAQVGLIVFLITWNRLPQAVPLPTLTAWLAGTCGLIGGMIAWATGRSLITVTSWSMYGMEQARRNMEEAREHRAQLSTLLKDLDIAYYRLERANSALVAAYKQVDRAEQFKSDFITRISHEMRTPLNLISGFSEMILSSPENYGGAIIPGAYRSDINSIYTSSQHLLGIVDEVLDLARMEVGKMILTREQVDLSFLVHEAAGMLKDYLSAKKLELQVELPEVLPLVYIDRLRIRQVLLNLLVNAARFTDHGSISVSAESISNQVIVRVSDTGRGIAPQDLPYIFEEYQTTTQPVGSWHSGSGLGLPISKKYVELHQGTMGVESPNQQGATFWFTLPTAAVSQPNNTQSNRSYLNYQTSMRLALDLVQPEQTVILIGEDQHARAALQRYFDNHTLLLAPSIPAAMEKARETQAVALLADVNQPTLENLSSGITVIHCPLPDSRTAASLLGVAEMVIKPFSSAQLHAAIRRVNRRVEHILVVDDDPEMVKLIQRILYLFLSEGRLRDAYSGEEALQQMRLDPPDLLLMDLSMPGMDGYEVLREMKTDSRLAQIPVIILSGMAPDHAELLSGPIHIEKGEGFTFGQIARAVEVLLNVLEQDRYQLPSMDEAPPAAPPE